MPDDLSELDTTALPPRNPKVFPALLGLLPTGLSIEMGGGLTLRDVLILQAMHGLIAGRLANGSYSHSSIATSAVAIADAILTARQASGNPPLPEDIPGK